MKEREREKNIHSCNAFTLNKYEDTNLVL